MKIHFIAVPALLIILVSCAHHRDVRPGVDGIHRVSLQASETEDGTREAIDQANHFCEERGKSAAFISEEKKYTGDMNEKDYKNVRRAGKVAQVVGSGVYTFSGHKKTSDVGGLGALGGSAANAVASDGYSVEMKFKCI